MHRLRTLHLFAGAGGGILADLLLGHQPVCAVEFDAYCQQVLAQRQADGALPWFPIFADVREFDGKPWRGLVDVVAGGFPCQDISTAGSGAGIDGERSGLWGEMARIIGEVRPRFAFVENSPALLNRGLGRVLGDMAALGYDCRWTVLSAADVGAHHQRARFWLVAADADQKLGGPRAWTIEQSRKFAHEHWHDDGEPGNRVRRWVEMARKFRRMDDGLAYEVERTAAIGNGQVPQCAAEAWRMLT